MKNLDFLELERLITATDRINQAAKILTKFSPANFEFGNQTISHDVGQIIENECERITEIIGDYNSWSITQPEERGEP